MKNNKPDVALVLCTCTMCAIFMISAFSSYIYNHTHKNTRTVKCQRYSYASIIDIDTGNIYNIDNDFEYDYVYIIKFDTNGTPFDFTDDVPLM